MALTCKDIEKAIFDKYGATSADAYAEFAEILEQLGRTRLPEVGDVTKLESNYGGWGYDNKEIYVVFSAGDKYFKINGWHSSWEGREWYLRVTEVEQVKVVTYKYKDKK